MMAEIDFVKEVITTQSNLKTAYLSKVRVRGNTDSEKLIKKIKEMQKYIK